jgi:diguanylate cyclase (GGDEF)-like protein
MRRPRRSSASVPSVLRSLSASIAAAAPVAEIGRTLAAELRPYGITRLMIVMCGDSPRELHVPLMAGVVHESAAALAGMELATRLLDPDVPESPPEPPRARLWHGVPLRFGSSRIGVLLAGPDEPARRAGALLATCADLIATAGALLHRLTRLESLFSEQSSAIAGVSDVVREINGSLDATQVSSLLLSHALAATGASSGVVLVPDDADLLRPAATEGVDAAIADYLAHVPLSVANIQTVVLDQEYRLVPTDELPAALQLRRDASAHLLALLCHDDRVRGVLVLAFNGEVGAVQSRFVQQLAAHAALALSNADAYAAIHRQHRLLDQRLAQLQAVARISQAISAHLTLDALLPEIVSAVRTTLGYRVALLSLVDTDQPRQVRRVASIGIPEAEWQALRSQVVPLSYYRSLMAEYYRISRSYYIPHDGVWMSDLAYDEILERSYRSELSEQEDAEWHPDDILLVPLYGHRGGMVGILSVDDPEDCRRPTPETITVLEIFATQAAAAIENARLFAEVERQALTDNLTGLANQRHFMLHLEQHISWAERHDQALALLALDIDRFKRYNDAYGHLAGNLVLREFAEVVRHSLRSGDMVARWGGEEFFALLPQSTREGAIEVAERIREAVKQHTFPNSSITVSVGVAMFDPGMRDHDLLEAADAALYRAKRTRDAVAT